MKLLMFKTCVTFCTGKVTLSSRFVLYWLS